VLSKPNPRGSLAITELSDIQRECSRAVAPKRPDTVFPRELKLEEVTNTSDDAVSTEDPF
jgi:hypothetical protein